MSNQRGVSSQAETGAAAAKHGCMAIGSQVAPTNMKNHVDVAILNFLYHHIAR